MWLYVNIDVVFDTTYYGKEDDDDDIFKIAVFEESGIENDGYCKLEERFGENFNV